MRPEPAHDGMPRSRAAARYAGAARRGAIWSFLRQSGNELVAIPISMIMARLLDPQDFGIAAAGLFFVLLAKRVTHLGFNAALVRVKVLRPEHESSVFAAGLAIGIATYAGLFAFAPLAGRFLRTPEAGSVIRVASLVFLISPLGMVAAARLQRNMQFRYVAFADWIDTLVGAVVTVIAALAGFGFWSIVYGHLVAVVAQVAVQMYLSGWIPSFGFSTAASRELLRFGAAVQSKRVLEYAALNMDNLVVGRVLGMTALGYYDKAFSTMDRLVTRLTLGQAPFRIFSIIHEDNERFRRGYARLITSVTLLGFPVLAACGVAADSLIVVLYGERWLPSVAPFQLLCAGGMCKLLNAYASQANEAAGNLWPQVQRQAIGMVLVVTGAALGGAYGGVAGAALGVTTAMVVLAVMMQALVRRATGFSWTAMLAPLVPASVGAALLAGVLLGVELMARSLVDDPARWQLLAAQMVVGGGFYAAFVLLSPFAAVRDLVRDSIEDLLPARSLDAFDRLTGLVRRARTL